MHSSTGRGIDAGADDRLTNGNRAELGRVKRFQRAEELAGRRARGAQDDGWTSRLMRSSSHGSSFSSGNADGADHGRAEARPYACSLMPRTTPAPSRRWMRLRIRSRERSTSRSHWASPSTVSVPPPARARVARCNRGADRQPPREVHLLRRQRRSREQARQHQSTSVASGFHPRVYHRASMDLVLASASPRRARPAEAAGFQSSARSRGESTRRREPGETPPRYVRRLARAKALEARASEPQRHHPRRRHGRGDRRRHPRQAGRRRDARDMLRLLSGRVHHVCTGVALWRWRRRSAMPWTSPPCEMCALSDGGNRGTSPRASRPTRPAPTRSRAWRPVS